jgi:integrase
VSGSVSQLPNGRWKVRWRTPDGHRPSKVVRTRKAAERYLRDRIDEIELGIAFADRSTTVSIFAENEWKRSKPATVSPRTWSTYESHYRVHIAPIVGRTKLCDVSTRTVQQLADQLTSSGKSAKTVRDVCSTFVQIIAMAVAQGRCRPLPQERQSRAQLPKTQRQALIVPTPRQVQAIADQIAAPLHTLVILCGTMGLRAGEALALHPADIDWTRGRIWVHRQINKETGQRVEGTKTNAGAWVTAPRIVSDALRRHIEEYPSPEWVFNSLGRPYTHSRLDKAWRAACKRAAVTGVRFHDLRHAAASLMISAGWNVKRVQTEIRHADPAFTLRVYGHLFPDDVERDRALLDQALATALSTSPEPEPGPHMDPMAA